MSATAMSTGVAAGVIAVAAAVPFRVTAPRRAVLPGFATTARATTSPSRKVGLIAAVVVVTLIAFVLVGPALTSIVAGVVVGVGTSRRRRGTRSARIAIETAMPDAVELLVMCLHSGFSPAQAIAQLAREAPPPVRPAFDAAEQRLHRGAGFAEALGELATSCGRCALPVVSAMSAAVRDGLPLAPVLDRLTDEAVESRRRLGEAAARRLPVRLSFPLVVCTLPSFVLLAIAPAVLGAISSLRGTAP